MNRDDVAKALQAEVYRRNEWYGLDNWTFKEVVDFVADRLYEDHCTCPVGFGQVRNPQCPRHGVRSPKHTITGAS